MWSSLWSSEIIRGHHCGYQRSWMVISFHQRTRARRAAAGRPRNSRIPATDHIEPSVTVGANQGCHQWSSAPIRDVISGHQRQSGMSSVLISSSPPEGAPWRALARTAGRPSPHRTPFDHPRHRRHDPRRWRPRRRPSADVWRVARRKPSLRRRPSRVPRGCCFWSPVIGGHQRSLEVIRGH